MKRVLIGVAVAVLVIVAGVVGYKIYQSKMIWDVGENTEKELREYQNYWLCDSSVLKAEKGYYFLVDDKKTTYQHICYWDGKSKNYDIVCEKANCKHDSDSCAACLNDNASNIQYSNGYIFYVDIDNKDNTYLYRMDSDGTNKKSMLKIADADMHVIDKGVFVHSNNVFVKRLMLTDDGYAGDILHYDMSERKPKMQEVCKYEEVEQIYIEDIHKDKLLYVALEEKGICIYEYNMKNKKSYLVESINTTFGSVKYAGKAIVYSTDKGIIMLKDGNPENKIQLTDGNVESVSFDGRYIYVDNVPMFFMTENEESKKHCVTVFDENGKKIYTIDMPLGSVEKNQMCYFGDTNMLFVRGFDSNEIIVLDKSKLDEGKWEGIIRNTQ